MKINKIGTYLVFLSFFFIAIFGFTNSVNAIEWNDYDYFDINELDSINPNMDELYDFVDMGVFAGKRQIGVIGETVSGVCKISIYSYSNDNFELLDTLDLTDIQDSDGFVYNRLKFNDFGLFAFGSSGNSDANNGLNNFTFIPYSGSSMVGSFVIQENDPVIDVVFIDGKIIVSCLNDGLKMYGDNFYEHSNYDIVDFKFGHIVEFDGYIFASLNGTDGNGNYIYAFYIDNYAFEIVDTQQISFPSLCNMFLWHDETVGSWFNNLYGPMDRLYTYITLRSNFDNVGSNPIDAEYYQTLSWYPETEKLGLVSSSWFNPYGDAENFYITNELLAYCTNVYCYINVWENNKWVNYYDNFTSADPDSEHFIGLSVFDYQNEIRLFIQNDSLLTLYDVNIVNNDLDEPNDVIPDDDEYYIEIFKSGTFDKPVGENWIDIYWKGLDGSNYWVALNNDDIPYIRGFVGTGNVEVIEHDFYWDGLSDLKFELINYTTFEVYATYILNADYWSDDDGDNIPNGEDDENEGGGFDSSTTTDSIRFLIGISICLIIGTFAAFMGAGATGWMGGFFGTMILVSRPQVGFLYFINDAVGNAVILIGIIIIFILLLANR